MNLEDLKTELESEGFRMVRRTVEHSPWMAYKRSTMPARRCECNDDKEGVQVTIDAYTFAHGGRVWESVEAGVTGQADGRWYKLTCYSLNPDEVMDQWPETEASLVRAWNALVQP